MVRWMKIRSKHISLGSMALGFSAAIVSSGLMAEEQWANGNPAAGNFGNAAEGHWGDPSEGQFGNLYSKEHLGRIQERENRLARYNKNKRAKPYIVLDRPVEAEPDSIGVALEVTGEALPESFETTSGSGP